MGLGQDPETIKERVTLPCQVYVSDYMIQNYPEIYQALKDKGCTFSDTDAHSPLYFRSKHNLTAIKILLSDGHIYL